MEYTKEQLFAKFQELPEEIRDSFVSIDTLEVIKEIMQKYGLHVDQGGLLSEQIALVMLGVTRPEDFLGKVEKALNIPLETAGEIVKDINEQIFFPIRESLKGVHNIPSKPDPYTPEPAPKVESTSTPFVPAAAPGGPADNPLNFDQRNQNIFDSKFSKMFNLPKEDVTVTTAATTPAPTPTPLEKSRPDPYREAV